MLQRASFLQMCLKILTCHFVIQIPDMLIIPSIEEKKIYKI